MKKIVSLLLVLIISIISMPLLFGCQTKENPKTNIIEIDNNNYWKYFNVTGVSSGGSYQNSFYKIEGILNFALYDNIIIAYDVIYYQVGDSEEEYKSYTIYIECNAAGNASFTVFSENIYVGVGKLVKIDGEQVDLESYNWKVQFKSISGNVIYAL